MPGKPKNLPEGIISEFRKKAEEIGINIDLKNLDERINGSTSFQAAFPEICKFEYQSEKDLKDIMNLLMALWNSYPRKEFGGKSPDRVFNESSKEASIKMMLAEELMDNIYPGDFPSEEEFKNAVNDFQKKWLNAPRKDMDGKTPMEVILEERQKTGNPAKGLHLSAEGTIIRMNEEAIESFFAENPEKEKLKTIYKREGEYAYVLAPIEYAIATYYLENPKTTDIDVSRALKNFRKNFDDAFGEESLEHRIQTGAREGLHEIRKQKKISRHEFFLIVDYLLWTISNRDWMGDRQAYLKWICNFFGLLKGKGKEEYEAQYKALGGALGLSKEHVSLLKDPPSEISGEAIKSAEKIGRNEPCPCGSGKKYKKCCLKI